MSLPNEVIARILKYADPYVLVQLSLSENNHLRSFSDVPELLRELDFCKSGVISNSDLVGFLSSERIQAVESLCLRGFEALQPVFFKNNYQWNSLRKLDISDCAINIYEFLGILEKLEELEEVSWSTHTLTQNIQCLSKRQKLKNDSNFQIKKLKTLNLDVMCKSFGFKYILGLLSLFREISILRLNVNHSYQRVSEVSDDESIFFSQSGDGKCIIPHDFKTFRFTKMKEFYLKSDKHQRWGRNYPITTHVRCICSGLHCFVKQRIADSSSLRTNISVIAKDMDFANDLTWVTERACLPIINIQSREMTLDILNWIKFHGGTTLKYLSMNNCNSDWRYCRVLLEIFETCPNIEELNLDEYFDSYQSNHLNVNCQHFSLLPKLRALVLSDFFLSSERKHKREYQLNLIATSNPHLEELEIRSNLVRCSKISDQDLVPIGKFLMLKKLVLFHISGPINGYCFEEIFPNLKHLTDLKIYHPNCELVSTSLCENFVQHLSLLSNLKVLCFHYKNLGLSFKSLWTALGLLKKLEFVCLGSDSTRIDNATTLGDFIINASNLEVFHVHSKSSNSEEMEGILKQRCFVNKPQTEVLIHNIGVHSNIFNVTKWKSFSTSFKNKRSLCWGMSDIGYGLKITCDI